MSDDGISNSLPTDLKQVEAKLRESEEKYSRVFHIAPYAIVISNASDGRFIDVNEAFTQMSGYSWTEALAGTAISLNLWVNPEDRNRMVTALLEGSTVRESEFKFRRKNGEIITALISAQIIHLQNETIMISSIQDITNNKMLEESLQREKQFSKSVLDSLPGIFYLYTYPENRLILWNRQHETLFGFTALEMKGRLVYDWHLPEYRTAVREAIEEIITRGQSSMESILVAKDGRQISFYLTGVRFESQGNLYYLGIGIDITERKQTDEMLKNSEVRYRNLYENSRDALMILDPLTLQFTSGNTAALDMFRIKNLEDFLTYTPVKLSPEKQPDGRLSLDKAREITEKAVRDGSYAFEWQHKRSDGELFPASVLLTRLELSGRHYIYASVRDITDIKKKSDTLERMNNFMVDRELKMVDLKKEIENLKNQLAKLDGSIIT